MRKRKVYAVIYTALNGEKVEVLFEKGRHAQRAQDALVHVGACILSEGDVLTCKQNRGVLVVSRNIFS
jgi:hypothetical protein